MKKQGREESFINFVAFETKFGVKTKSLIEVKKADEWFTRMNKNRGKVDTCYIIYAGLPRTCCRWEIKLFSMSKALRSKNPKQKRLKRSKREGIVCHKSCVTENNKTNLFVSGMKDEKRHSTNYNCRLYVMCTYYGTEQILACTLIFHMWC